MSQPQFTFYYFDAYARAECVRILLGYCNVKYVDYRVTFQEWGGLKGSMPNGQIPCIEFPDGTRMG